MGGAAAGPLDAPSLRSDWRDGAAGDSSGILIQTWAQQYSSPTRTALIFSTEPVFAWATSMFFWGKDSVAAAFSAPC